MSGQYLEAGDAHMRYVERERALEGAPRGGYCENFEKLPIKTHGSREMLVEL